MAEANFKKHRIVSLVLRNFAEKKECTMRLEGRCNGNTETTIHAHLRKFAMSGNSQKPDDIFGFHSCSDCHLYQDEASWEQLLCAVCITQMRLLDEGIIKVLGDKIKKFKPIRKKLK